MDAADATPSGTASEQELALPFKKRKKALGADADFKVRPARPPSGSLAARPRLPGGTSALRAHSKVRPP